MSKFIKNCCNGMYNSFDIHFTSSCDNKCNHCIDKRFYGTKIKKPLFEEIKLSEIQQCFYKLFNKNNNNYGVIYEDGSLMKGWK